MTSEELAEIEKLARATRPAIGSWLYAEVLRVCAEVRTLTRRAAKWKRVAMEYKRRYKLPYLAIEQLRLSPEVAEALRRISDGFNETVDSLIAEHKDEVRALTELTDATLAVRTTRRALAAASEYQVSTKENYDARFAAQIANENAEQQFVTLLDAYEQRKREAEGA